MERRCYNNSQCLSQCPSCICTDTYSMVPCINNDTHAYKENIKKGVRGFFKGVGNCPGTNAATHVYHMIAATQVSYRNPFAYCTLKGLCTSIKV